MIISDRQVRQMFAYSTAVSFAFSALAIYLGGPFVVILSNMASALISIVICAFVLSKTAP